MNKENTELLFKQYPILYSSHTWPDTKALMCYGFACGNGWFDIIWDLSELLEGKCKAVQVKEKFGTLRFYVSYNKGLSKQEIENMNVYIRHFGAVSGFTCELCGEFGKIRKDIGWIRTLCPWHYFIAKLRFTILDSWVYYKYLKLLRFFCKKDY